MYKKLKMRDGHPLVGELHQLMPMAHVEVIHPNCPDGEQMMLQMDKNVVAYLTHYLVEEGKMAPEFVGELMRGACDPSLFSMAKECEWDSKTWSIITTAEKAREGEPDMKKAAWYKTDFQDLLTDSKGKKKKGKKEYADPENIYKLDDKKSVNTIHPKSGSEKDTGYGGSPGAPAFKIGSKQKQQRKDKETIEINSDSDKEKDDELENLSKEELIERLRRTKLDSDQRASAPGDDGWSLSQSSDDEGSSSSSEGSYLDSSSGSSIESVKVGGETPSG